MQHSASRSTRATAILALRLVAAAGRFWYVRGHLVEGSAWLEDALALASSEPSAIRATACMRAGYLADALEDVPLAQRHYLEALEIRRSLGDRPASAVR